MSATSIVNFPGYHVSRKDGRLHLGNVDLGDVCRTYGSPLYVYDFDRIRDRSLAIMQELALVSKGSRAFFAVKALGNLSALNLISKAGLGMDVVSGGEIQRCLAANIPASDIIFSGVAKSKDEIELGVNHGIKCFNIESPHEVELLEQTLKNNGRPINVALRINPDVDGQTHKKINTGPADTKFGLNPHLAMSLAKRILGHPFLRLDGISCHIGSQILELQSFAAAAREMKQFAQELRALGAPLHHIDMGGGIGVAYRPTDLEKVPSFKDWITISRSALPFEDMDLYVEPGRSIVGDAGILLTQILDIKKGSTKKFALVDAGMTELLRPAMYDAYHHIEPLIAKEPQSNNIFDVVGPVCETSCWLGESVHLGAAEVGDILAVMTAGAYGMSMASNYNSRPRLAEVAVEKTKVRLIRKRETLDALWADERSLLS